MALTTEQQSILEFSIATAKATAEQQEQVEASRHANLLEMQAKTTKLEAIRLAKEVLIENARNKSIDEREVTVSDITTFAAAIEAHINS